MNGTLNVQEIATAIRRHWWLFVLRGLLAILFGLLALMWPGATVMVLTAFVAAYALVDGLVTLASAFRLKPLFSRWWLLLIHGLISAVFGVLALFYPGIALVYIAVSVALWWLFAGIAQFALAQAHKAMGGSSGWGVFGGILSVVLAAAAIVRPGLTVATIAVLIGWFALIIGALQMVAAFRVRQLATKLKPA